MREESLLVLDNFESGDTREEGVVLLERGIGEGESL